MPDLLILAIMGATEGVVYLLRYRSANGPSAALSAAHTFLLAVLRVVFVATGAKAAMEGHPIGVLAFAYAIPAAVATGAVHGWVEGRKGRVAADRGGSGGQSGGQPGGRGE